MLEGTDLVVSPMSGTSMGGHELLQATWTCPTLGCGSRQHCIRIGDPDTWTSPGMTSGNWGCLFCSYPHRLPSALIALIKMFPGTRP